jgi:hypothetical protein
MFEQFAEELRQLQDAEPPNQGRVLPSLVNYAKPPGK